MYIPSPQAIPLSLYVHFPWCIQKCPYCDFNSHTLKGDLPEFDYIQKLIDDLNQVKSLANQRPLQSIFFGGGTPSLFSPKSISLLMDSIHNNFDLSPTIEITLEANPSTVEQQRFKDYRQLGVNRISLGIQSFEDTYLKRLGRVHDAAEAKSAIQAVQNAGFKQYNLDLMFGLPEQNINDALKDLQTAIEFSPPHLSWYELTIEPNTAFAYHPPALPSSDALWEIQTEGQARLHQHGLIPYEVSAYTNNQPCQHNLNYWTFGDYLAVGAGAHGKITLNHKDIMRYQFAKHPKQYLTQPFAARKQSFLIPEDELPFEYFLNTLRLTNGQSLEGFSQRTGLSIEDIRSTLNKLINKGWLAPDAKTLKTTPLGFRFLNDVTETFLAA